MTTTPHRQTPLPLDERTMKQAQTCVHCGLCLPACPTYTQTGVETESPRGRIYLMKGMAEGKIELSDTVMGHLESCLDCRACETACPSGVVYHELIEEARTHLVSRRKLSFSQRVVDWMSRHVLAYPTRVKLALLPARVLQRVGLFGAVSRVAARVLGPSVGKMNDMLPAKGRLWERRLGDFYPATHEPAAGTSPRTVGMFAGCVGSVLFQETNRKTIELLNYLGCDVVVPPSQVCCGAMHHHGGRPGEAAAMAQRNIEAFDAVDVVVNNIAGCGAMLREYDHLLRDDARWAGCGKRFIAKVRDINVLLTELNPPPPTHAVERTATYHDACHLAHGQKITVQPRQLLADVPGLKLLPLAESEMCCGAAGTYNLQHPEMARQLAERKLRHVRATGATLVVTANVGCAMQIQSEAARAGMRLDVAHPVEVLHAAYGLGSPDF